MVIKSEIFNNHTNTKSFINSVNLPARRSPSGEAGCKSVSKKLSPLTLPKPPILAQKIAPLFSSHGPALRSPKGEGGESSITRKGMSSVDESFPDPVTKAASIFDPSGF